VVVASIISRLSRGALRPTDRHPSVPAVTLGWTLPTSVVNASTLIAPEDLSWPWIASSRAFLAPSSCEEIPLMVCGAATKDAAAAPAGGANSPPESDAGRRPDAGTVAGRAQPR